MWTAEQIVKQACEDAHVPGFTAQGQTKLQLLLDTLCFTGDFAAARGVYNFNLNPNLVTTFQGFANFSGPYPLPLDYLRTSGSSGAEGTQTAFFYVVYGVPYTMVPWDLGKMDIQVQYPAQNSFPSSYATDIATETTAQDRMAGTTTAVTAIGSPTIHVTDPSGMLVGMGVAGLGIAAGSTIIALGSPPQPGSFWGSMIWGKDPWGGPPAGTAIPPGMWGSMIWGTDFWGPGKPANPGAPVPLPPDPNRVVLSLPSTGTFANASIMFGTPPAAYIYPGPSGAFPAVLRYQRLMPPLIDFTRIPWYQDQEYLLEKLTASLMSGADDARRETFFGRAEVLRGKYETFSDDKTSRAQRVQMDHNNFRSWARRGLRTTKTVGW